MDDTLTTATPCPGMETSQPLFSTPTEGAYLITDRTLSPVAPSPPSPLMDHLLERAVLSGGLLHTTPLPPLHEGVGKEHGGFSPCSISTSTLNSSTFYPERRYPGFSSTTCLEILSAGTLSTEQIARERQILANLGLDNLSSENDSVNLIKLALEMDISKKNNDNKIEAISDQINSLTDQINILSEVAEENRSILRSVSRRKISVGGDFGDSDQVIANADELLAEIGHLFPSTSGSDRPSTPITEQVLNVSNDKLPSSVCNMLSADLMANLSVDRILEQIPISKSLRGGRKVEYFGSVPYIYGDIRHDAKPYPQCDFFNELFDKLSSEIDKSITRDNYTCLLTLYESGRVGIPRHSDNVQQEPEDNIYTISVGAEREITFINTEGPLLERNVTLPHGSVYAMSTESQATWAHSIKPDKNVVQPRISITLRRLTNVETNAANKTEIPPIREPYHKEQRIPENSHGRVVLLTDSILKHTPEFVFDRMGDYRCVKKLSYQLSNVFEYENEFKYSDYVIFSSGINDLARYGKSPTALADKFLGRMRDVCARHPNTTFVLSSLLSTKFPWLNAAAGQFNKLAFELSLELGNFVFYDSHAVLVESGVHVLDNGGDGVHVTSTARRKVTDCLVEALSFDVSKRSGRVTKANKGKWAGYSWPLRPEFRTLLM